MLYLGMADSVATIRARYVRSLTSPGMLDRARLWLQLTDLITESPSQPLAHAIAEYLDAAYVESTIAAYGHGVEDGRTIGGEHATKTIEGLRQQVGSLEKQVRILTGAASESAAPVMH